MNALLAKQLYRMYGCHNPKLADERWEQLPSAVKESYVRDADGLLMWLRDNNVNP